MERSEVAANVRKKKAVGAVVETRSLIEFFWHSAAERRISLYGSSIPPRLRCSVVPISFALHRSFPFVSESFWSARSFSPRVLFASIRGDRTRFLPLFWCPARTSPALICSCCFFGILFFSVIGGKAHGRWQRYPSVADRSRTEVDSLMLVFHEFSTRKRRRQRLSVGHSILQRDLEALRSWVTL